MSVLGFLSFSFFPLLLFFLYILSSFCFVFLHLLHLFPPLSLVLSALKADYCSERFRADEMDLGFFPLRHYLGCVYFRCDNKPGGRGDVLGIRSDSTCHARGSGVHHRHLQRRRAFARLSLLDSYK